VVVVEAGPRSELALDEVPSAELAACSAACSAEGCPEGFGGFQAPFEAPARSEDSTHPVTREDERTLLWLALGYFVLRAWDPVSNALSKGDSVLKRGGAMLFDLTHGDIAHVKDLPRPERMLTAKAEKRRLAIAELAKTVGFPDPVLAAAIAMAESGGNPKAVADTPAELSVGLWQINLKAHKQYTRPQMENPLLNAKAAFAISRQGKDWRPWGAYTNGSYKRFVP
jgi:Lysozyme like domain